ncbi:MAG: MATE family efflux transporter [Hyphomicrobiales bacterium]|nr:MATE family efflux transporter [Hyphomicrobiales bacterium]
MNMPPAASAESPVSRFDRESRLIQPALLKPLARLALPTVAVMFMITALNITETYFVSSLGTEAVAAASLVVPVALLVTMVSNGGIGGGVSSAIARARGRGDQAAAESLLWHAILLGVAFGALTTGLAWSLGPRLYRALGGAGAVLSGAIIYSNILFGAAVASWTLVLVQAALRGAGNVKAPALTIAGSVCIGLAISPALIAGAFGWPGLGVAGAGVAQAVTSVGGLFVLLVYLRRPGATLRLAPHPLSRAKFAEILAIGLPSSLNALMSALALTAATAAAGAYGESAIAGYGVAARLDTLLVPILFGFGAAAVTLVGMSIGAGDVRRARAVALTNAVFVAAPLGAFGLLIALWPTLWLSIFTRDPNVIAAGSDYLSIVAPTYALNAIAMELYFAGQGARRIFWPMIATFSRVALALAAVALVRLQIVGLSASYGVIAAGVALGALITIAGFLRDPWPNASSR